VAWSGCSAGGAVVDVEGSAAGAGGAVVDVEGSAAGAGGAVVDVEGSAAGAGGGGPPGGGAGRVIMVDTAERMALRPAPRGTFRDT
jgi:hypothetical protein